MLGYRILSGLALMAFVLLLFWGDGRIDAIHLPESWRPLFADRPTPPAGLLLVVAAFVIIPLAVRELTAIFRANGIDVGRWLISSMAIAAALAVFVVPLRLTAPTGAVIVSTVLVVSFVIALLRHSRHAQVKGAIAVAGATMFAVTYIGLFGGFFLAMRRWHSAWVVLAVVLITKSCDVGAYFTGRALGRHKLVPWLSPKKTWEGLAGGILFAMAFSAALAWVSQVTEIATVYRTAEDGSAYAEAQRYDLMWAAAAGAVFAVVGHIGDLAMSLFKRDAGMKDSGNLIPGMGGVMDVMDSPLFVAPVAYWMLELATMK